MIEGWWCDGRRRGGRSATERARATLSLKGRIGEEEGGQKLLLHTEERARVGRTKEGEERNKSGGHAFKNCNVKTRCKQQQRKRKAMEDETLLGYLLLLFCALVGGVA